MRSSEDRDNRSSYRLEAGCEKEGSQVSVSLETGGMDSSSAQTGQLVGGAGLWDGEKQKFSGGLINMPVRQCDRQNNGP